jgi:hypothetical protein
MPGSLSNTIHERNVPAATCQIWTSRECPEHHQHLFAKHHICVLLEYSRIWLALHIIESNNNRCQSKPKQSTVLTCRWWIQYFRPGQVIPDRVSRLYVGVRFSGFFHMGFWPCSDTLPSISFGNRDEAADVTSELGILIAAGPLWNVEDHKIMVLLSLTEHGGQKELSPY